MNALIDQLVALRLHGMAACAQDLLTARTPPSLTTALSTDVFAVGAAVYWDDTAKLITSTTSGNTKVGVAVTAAVNPSGSVNVRLNGTF